MRLREAVAIITLLLAAAVYAAPVDVLSRHDALAASCDRGAGYHAALAAKARARVAALAAARLAAAREREARFIESQTRYYSGRHGRRVGRWFGLVYAYWPRAEWGRAMLCMKRESGGEARVLGAAGEIGLFQLLDFRCQPWDPDTNVRLAAKMWRANGWGPWTTMRAYR